jgi:folate-dependent tRNA-U54 methylase TrmFO/GidA
MRGDYYLDCNMKIEEVKKYIEAFCKVEAEAYTLRRKPNLEAYNECVFIYRLYF